MERGYWIRSKPVYSTLIWQAYATAHLILVEGAAGAMAALKLFQQMQPEQQVSVFYLKDTNADNRLGETLNKVAPDDFFVHDSSETLLIGLDHYLSKAKMGLHIYVAGAEKFMWSIADVASRYGVVDGDIHKELTGTLARSVYCVHCKTITHEAHTNIKQCDGCGRMLFVRDHFSRRFGAYMGLMVDAVAPGEIPDIEEIYP